ncbi:hypothetical protein CLOM_g4159 [Closterium sp. NIES-68]|nr:hypothetical protein CLOM_g4159 [Closterium sp. NIES-68]
MRFLCGVPCMDAVVDDDLCDNVRLAEPDSAAAVLRRPAHAEGMAQQGERSAQYGEGAPPWLPVPRLGSGSPAGRRARGSGSQAAGGASGSHVAAARASGSSGGSGSGGGSGSSGGGAGGLDGWVGERSERWLRYHGPRAGNAAEDAAGDSSDDDDVSDSGIMFAGAKAELAARIWRRQVRGGMDGEGMEGEGRRGEEAEMIRLLRERKERQQQRRQQQQQQLRYGGGNNGKSRELSPVRLAIGDETGRLSEHEDGGRGRTGMRGIQVAG